MIFIGLVSLLVPTVLWGIETAISRLASFGIARTVHAGLLGLLLGLVVWQPLQDSAAIAGLALILVAVVVTVLYLRLELIRNFALMLSVATPVVIVLFAASYPIRYEILPGDRALAAQQAETQPPVVMIVLDELPLALLENERGQIDRRLIPSLARIQDESTWYPRTLAVGDETLAALPSIMTGQDADFNEEKAPPGLPSYPDNVCSVTAKAGYRVHASEVVTDLCQRKSGLRTRISDLLRLGLYPRAVSLDEAAENRGAEPTGDENLTPGRLLEKGVDEVVKRYPSPPPAWGAERPGNMRNFGAGLDVNPGGFNFLHILLPHAPYQFTDEGRGYGSLVLGDTESQDALENPTNLPESRKHMQQALAQTISTMNMVEEIIDRMKKAGTWDESLFVLTADHGASFEIGAPRRTVIEKNEGWLLPVPLFIKYPGQEKGEIDPRFATSRDIAPTIFDVLGLKPSPKATGHSLLGPPVPAPERLDVTSQETGRLTVDPENVAAQEQAAVRMRAGAFGSGSLFAIGGKPELLGTKSARDSDLRPLKAEFTTGGPEIEADPNGFFVPSYVQALLPETNSDPGTIAVTVNGKVAATTRAWQRDGVWMTAVNVPDSSFRKGENELALFSYLP